MQKSDMSRSNSVISLQQSTVMQFANYELHYTTRQTTLCLKKGYHQTTNDNFNSSCLITVIFGTNIAE